MIERLFIQFRRVPDYVSWILATALAYVALGFLVDQWLMTGIAYIPLMVFIEQLSRSPSFLGWLIAHRNRVALLFVLGLVAVGVVLAFVPGPDTPGTDPGSQWLYRYLYAPFFAIGILLGVLLRQSCGNLAFAALFGKRRLGVAVGLMCIWTLVLALFPWREHVSTRALYVIGIAAGVAIHKGSRLAFARVAAAYRRIQNIADAWPPTIRATQAEWEALELLQAGRDLPNLRFRRLRTKLEEWRTAGAFTLRLALISASLYRLEGDYMAAIKEIEGCNAAPEDPETAHLLLLNSLNLTEVGKDREAEKILDQLLASDGASKCPLAHSTKALRSAEIALKNIDVFSVSEKPLEFALKADTLRRTLMAERMKKRAKGSQTLDDLLGRFVEFGMPVTAPSLLDILGYCHLAAGHLEQGLIMFRRCIELDPDCPSVYLHLGDYFLFRSILPGGTKTPRKEDWWHATACYEVTRGLERNPGSRLTKLAQERLSLVSDNVDG